jgi:hypothetical protein
VDLSFSACLFRLLSSLLLPSTPFTIAMFRVSPMLLLFALLPALAICGRYFPNAIEGEAQASAEVFQSLEDSGPINTVSEFLDFKSRLALMNCNKILRKSSLFNSNTIYQIPEDATNETVRANLPSIKRFNNVLIGLNVEHLDILKKEYPSLRHLIVRSVRPLRPFNLRTKAYVTRQVDPDSRILWNPSQPTPT